MTRAELGCLTLLLCSSIPACGRAQSTGTRYSGVHTVPKDVRDEEDSLVARAQRTYPARPAPPLRGWAEAVRSVERSAGLSWRGLPAVVLLVHDAGRGFTCDGEARCLARFLGARIIATEGDTSVVTYSSIVLLAESVAMRREVWEHELTHALLAQYGLEAESSRHDRRYFHTDHAIILDRR
jgi:hypothetical protein